MFHCLFYGICFATNQLKHILGVQKLHIHQYLLEVIKWIEFGTEFHSTWSMLAGC